MASSRDLHIPNPLQSGSTPRADEDRLLPTIPSSARPQPPTLIKLKVPPPSSPAASSSISELSSTGPMTPPHSGTSTLPSSPPPAKDGQGTHSKRSRTETDSSIDEPAPSNPPAKAARLDATSATNTPSMTEELANQFQGSDHEFGRDILGLLVRHKSILKTQGTALAAVEDLKQDLSRERKEKEAMRLQRLELDKKRGEERTAAASLAKENEAELTRLKKERDTARRALADTQSKLLEVSRREARVFVTEKEARQVAIQRLEDRLAKEERQHGLAVKNADASRHARNEAQNALAVIQTDKDQLTQELETMTTNHENVTMDLEETRASLHRAQTDAAALISVKAELLHAQSEAHRLLSVNAELSTSAEKIEKLKEKLENLGKVAQDRLDDKNQMEIQLGEARTEAREWKQKGEEYRKNYNVAVGNLHKSEIELKEFKRDNKDIKREGNGEGQAEGSRAEREIIDMTGA